MHSDLLPIDLDLLSVSDWTCGLLYQSCLDILNCTPSVKTLSDLCPWLPAGLPSWSNSDLSTARQPKQTLKAKRTLNISLVFYTLWHSAMTSFDSSIHFFFFLGLHFHGWHTSRCHYFDLHALCSFQLLEIFDFPFMLTSPRPSFFVCVFQPSHEIPTHLSCTANYYACSFFCS